MFVVPAKAGIHPFLCFQWRLSLERHFARVSVLASLFRLCSSSLPSFELIADYRPRNLSPYWMHVTMPLVLYGHCFSSYTQKVLISLYENGTAHEFRSLGPDTPEHTAEWLRRWPIGKFPLLVDEGRSIVETSIIIEYLQLAHPGPVRLIPEDPMSALDVRFLDRFFDLHVMHWVQHAVGAALTGDAVKRDEALSLSRQKLELAYAWLETQLASKTWAAGAQFTLADCAAAPALFYADWTHRISETHSVLRAYRARLLARPSFARAVDEARWYRSNFPLGAPDRD